VRKADNVTTILFRCREIWELITSWNPLGHSRPVTGLLYLFYIILFRRKIPTDEIDETCRKRGEDKKFIMNFIWKCPEVQTF
jgi:hypothetical protein